jgi:hypothetical protein
MEGPPPEGIAEFREKQDQVMLEDGSTYEGEWIKSPENPDLKMKEGFGT